MKKFLFNWIALIAVALLAVALPAGAADKYKPFVLASNGPGDFVKTITEVKTTLRDEGFTIAGEYSPYENAHVIAITNSQLRALGDSSDGGAYLMALRVTVSKVGGNIQVSYMNPVYFQYGYRIKEDLSSIGKKLADSLGNKQEFGAKGLTARKLKKYHYTFGMEYFDEPHELAKYDSHEAAIKAIEANLEKNVAGVGEVFRVDSPNGDVTTFGVSMSDGFSGDQKIMSIIDFKDLKQVGHLPYEMVVRDGKVYALSARFRIALDFPDLSMMGDNSFMRITKSPDAIQQVLTKAAGGSYETPEESSDFF